MGEVILSDREMEEEKGRVAWGKLEELVFENRWVVAGGLLGLIFLGGGFFLVRAGIFEGTRVEVIEESSTGNTSSTGSGVVVEIAGEVMSPGVYKLEAGSRVEDLLVASGGLSAKADREWVEKNLNRAARVLDGAKIYVPSVEEVSSEEWVVRTGLGSGIVGGATSKGLININTASQAQLESLWGIGPARASAIIEGRPFSSVEELLTKKIIPSNVYERVKDEITAQ